MGLGASLFLIAGGAILVWGVTSEVAGLDVNAIGVILMVVGIVGLVLSMIFWSSWGGCWRRPPACHVRRRGPARRPGLLEPEDVKLRGQAGHGPGFGAFSRAASGSTFAPRTSTSK